MNRIDKKFKLLRASNKKGFIAYVTAGDPDLPTTKRIVLALERSGVDIIELGIPFSDPVADGPTIQAASQRALKRNASLKKIFAMVASIRKESGVPIVFMTYYNPVLQYGLKKFAGDCRRFGVDGVIVPDLPLEESSDLLRVTRKEGVALVFLVAPTSTAGRIREITRASRGFVYYVSRTGVTGTRSSLSTEVDRKVRMIKAVTEKPVAVGFGISNIAQARQAAGSADAVIVGSALVNIVGKHAKSKAAIIKEVSRFAAPIARAIHNG